MLMKPGVGEEFEFEEDSLNIRKGDYIDGKR